MDSTCISSKEYHISILESFRCANKFGKVVNSILIGTLGYSRGQKMTFMFKMHVETFQIGT